MSESQLPEGSNTRDTLYKTQTKNERSDSARLRLCSRCYGEEFLTVLEANAIRNAFRQLF